MVDTSVPLLLAIAFIVYFGVVAYERIASRSNRVASVAAGAAAVVIAIIYLFSLF